MNAIEVGSEGCRLQLHKTVFEGDLKTASKLLWNCDINTQDVHGNTALHLAAMLGHHDMVVLLLSHGATVRIKNNLGWTPLAEAISYGNKNTVSSLLTKMQEQLFAERQRQIPRLAERFEQLGDFEMELQWHFHTWLPLLSRLLPSDVCKIKKKGNKIRLDSTLLDFSDSKWQKGDVTFVFSMQKHQPLVVMDNRKRLVQYFNSKTSSHKDTDVDFLMNHSILHASLCSSSISFHKCYSGLFFSHSVKTENIGTFTAECYVANNLVLMQKKRREHLPHDRESSHKNLVKALQTGSSPLTSDFTPLPPPPPTMVTWHEYIHSPPSRHPTLSRPIILKESNKHYKAYVSMSKDFPLQTPTLLDLLELMSPMKHFSKLREFLNTKLPPGFPIKIEIPILPTITATAMFTHFEWSTHLPDSLFNVPSDYTQAPVDI